MAQMVEWAAGFETRFVYRDRVINLPGLVFDTFRW